MSIVPPGMCRNRKRVKQFCLIVGLLSILCNVRCAYPNLASAGCNIDENHNLSLIFQTFWEKYHVKMLERKPMIYECALKEAASSLLAKERLPDPEQCLLRKFDWNQCKCKMHIKEVAYYLVFNVTKEQMRQNEKMESKFGCALDKKSKHALCIISSANSLSCMKYLRFA
ncbi:unnamed protein product [Cylicocyclus nassatus]|uniref:Uncharacterized protein n=1 Tax=Cylicocyclus nassatus TaxID=53992 RepID=A0AA36GUD0_CYLNA|nr:unnamed protein product [Cylicocyclus nassatus]